MKLLDCLVIIQDIKKTRTAKVTAHIYLSLYKLQLLTHLIVPDLEIIYARTKVMYVNREIAGTIRYLPCSLELKLSAIIIYFV